MFKLNNYPLGLNITDSYLYLTQLKKSGGLKFSKKSIENLEINCYNKLKLPEGLIVNGEIKQPEELVNQINKLLDTVKGENKINKKEVVISLPSSQAFVKLIHIPNIKEEDIEKNINEEIVKHIPIALQDVYLDWQIVDKQNDYLEILVNTASKQTIDQYTNILEKASLQPIAIETEAAAICRSLIIDVKNPKHKKDNGPFLIINLGELQSNIIICSEDAIFLIIENQIASSTMTQQIATTLSISIEQAEKVKKVCGLDKDQCKGAVREMLDETINQLISDINQAITFFQSTYGEKIIKKIILCGSGANILGAETVISEQLQIPTEKGNPWNKINNVKNSKNEEINNDILSYVTAIGLSLRGTIGD